MRLLPRTALIAAGLFAVAACSSGEPAPPEPSGSQRIVFVGPRFDIWTVQGDGSNPARLTGGRTPGVTGTDVALRSQQEQRVRYTWPTWSPDGGSVAVSRTPGIGGGALASLVLFDAEGSAARPLHETHPLAIPLVATGAPHYALWAPTSETLSFVAPRGPGQGLGLFVVRPGDGGPYEVAADAPLYHVWSPDGRYILVHRRGELLLHDTRDRSTTDLGADSLRYRVPAFSPDGDRIAYVVEEDGAGRLVTSNLDGSDRVPLMDIPGEAAFAWSPGGGSVAVGTKGFSAVLYDDLHVVDGDGAGANEPLVRERVAAFYWSPDGSRIAYVTVDGPMEWRVIDLTSGESRRRARFIPSADFLTHVQFFDQFAPSHLVWSADSTTLVFSGVIERGAARQVWVVDAVGSEDPRPIGEGRLAFWAPSPTK
ncbi:MAG: hypothetical protein OXL97_12995 [Chloroflexota bacterium]|nr:hypothetical protein [Chloroflexota bacterium]MDE2883779.1 hypothetical protein [Chloroflexota bacterium]